MQSLMEELTSTENKIFFPRRAYNDSVMVYNTQREIFSGSIIASTFHCDAAELFTIDVHEQA
ncbi:MAG: LemA family protein [Kiritimatiellae bacterium]|jgi:LemA protein|nr:LemA family protein [Kiritimatiellia bacterium]